MDRRDGSADPLPTNPAVTYEELVRIGMPSTEGYSIKTFSRFYVIYHHFIAIDMTGTSPLTYRTMTDEKGEPWFVGKDVAVALGYSNTRDALRKHVEDEDKTTVAICDTGSNYKSNAVIINESGLYSLILSSKLPSAKQFKHWVTAEVLPQIRKTGGYGEVKPLTDIEIMARAVLISAKQIEELTNPVR